MPTTPEGCPDEEQADSGRPPFPVDARHCGFRAGVDIHHLNRLNDEIEAEDFRRERRRDIDRQAKSRR